jgi:hypothetical protein
LKRDHILVVISTALMAIHVIYATLAANESMIFSFSLFIFPYLVVSSIWSKLKEIYKLSILIIFQILEFNHLATDTIPSLIKNGLNTSNFDAIFYIPCVLLLVVTFFMLVNQRVRRSKEEKSQPYL